ncbi:hypothetical protein BKA70DRAFT_450966 [Coprinopsis sp. MPI-PUGE-AT-0042]|nr:hypothetical protein BKA70DRAFT_450966 [Coprinopsis sp. MPI-PUGE-AT-0042]
MPKQSKFETILADVPSYTQWRYCTDGKRFSQLAPSGNVIEVLDAFLPHICIPGAEKEPPAVIQGRSRKARLASSVLLLCLKDSVLQERKTALSERIITNLDKIIWWQKELLTRCCAYHDSPTQDNALTGFLLPSYRLTQDLAEAILDLPSATELTALSLASGCLTKHLLERPTYCYIPLLFLVASLLNSPESKGIFLDVIFDRGSSAINGFVSVVVGIAAFLKVHVSCGDKCAEVSETLSAYRRLLNSLSDDPRYRGALRKHKYINHFLELLGILFNRNPAYHNDVVICVTTAFWWIEVHQPRRARKSLLRGGILSGGLWIRIHAVQNDIEEDEAEEAMCSFLGFTSSQRVRAAIKHVLDNVENHLMQRTGLHETRLRVFYPWHIFALSFAARLPDEESVEITSRGKSLTFCNNVTHFEITRSSDQVAGLRTCCRCRAVVYCCESCQREDWVHVHRLECRKFSEDNAALTRDGIPLARTATHNFEFVSRCFIPVPEAVEEQMLSHKAALERGEVIYIEQDAENPGEIFEIVSVDQYRQTASGYTLWSPSRFDALLQSVQRTDGMQLVSFVVPCQYEKLHLLCVLMGTSNLIAGMAQIKYQ